MSDITPAAQDEAVTHATLEASIAASLGPVIAEAIRSASPTPASAEGERLQASLQGGQAPAVRRTTEFFDPAIAPMIAAFAYKKAKDNPGMRIHEAVDAVTRSSSKSPRHELSLFYENHLNSMSLAGYEDTQRVDIANVGGLLVPDFVNRVLIEKREEKELFFQLGIPQEAFQNGLWEADKITGNPSVTWLGGEFVAPPLTGMTAERVREVARKLGAVIPATHEAMNRSQLGDMQRLQRELLNATSRERDTTLLLSDGSEPSAPVGIRGLSTTSIPAGPYNAADSPEQKLQNILRDIRSVTGQMNDVFSNMTNPVCVMSDRDNTFVNTFRTTGAVTNPLGAQDIRASLGSFNHFGTTKIPTTLGGGGDESYVMFLDAADFVYLENTQNGVRIKMTEDASLEDGSGNMVSLWQRDAGAVMVTVECGLTQTHTSTGIILTGVKWGV